MSDDPNPLVVSYHSAVLYRDDLALLEDGCWLNDHVIVFWQEKLEREVWSLDIRDRTLFVQPQAVRLAQYMDSEELGEVLAALPFRSKEVILMPITNSSDAGGLA
jgi:hypothetical protein